MLHAGRFSTGDKEDNFTHPKNTDSPRHASSGRGRVEEQKRSGSHLPNPWERGFFPESRQKEKQRFYAGERWAGGVVLPRRHRVSPRSCLRIRGTGSWLEARGLNPSPRPRPSASLQTARREGLKTFTSPLKYHFNFKGLGAGSATSGWKEQAKAPLVLPTRAKLKSTLVVRIIATRGQERSIPTAASSPPARRKKKAD